LKQNGTNQFRAANIIEMLNDTTGPLQANTPRLICVSLFTFVLFSCFYSHYRANHPWAINGRI
jgi:hypothetical protein